MTDDSANTEEAANAAQPVGKRASEEGRVSVLARVSLLNECCEECWQMRVI